LDPFYLALSRVLGHDAMVTTFMWLSLLAFLRAMESKSESQRVSVHNSSFTIHNSKFLVISGALGGLAFLSKYPALFLGAFVAAAMLVIYWLKPPQKNIAQSAMGGLGVVIGRWLKDISLWSLAAGVVFVLLWPAMWVDPLAPITAILSDALRASGGSHPKGSFFLGQPAPDPGALFYPLVLLLRTTPITFLGLLVAGWGVVGPSKPAQQKVVQPAWVLLAFVLLYTLLVTVGGKKQDRYLLPAFPAMAMLAAIGFTWTGGAFARFTRQPSTLPAVLLVVQLFMVYPYYPYYFSYYNPLAGGGRAAVSLLQVGWGEGLNEAAAYLNSLPAGASGRVTAWYSTTFEPYFNGHAIYKIDDEKISRSPKPGLAADYVVFYINQVQRQLPSAGALQFFRAQPLLHTVTINGIDYAWVYPSVGMAHVFANEARLVGQAELLGYNLSTESGQPVVAIVPESVLRVALYWEWQGKAPTDMLGLSLVDDAGQTRGWGNRIETVAPLPFEQWQDGMVARDDFALVIFADTPPGEYRLAAWIERPDTGETVGVFPLEETITVTPR
jgi:4-amino-4-deoxy-L-arabinose transferase-like glycosyltransferase